MIRTTANYTKLMDGDPSRYEIVDPVSITVPDMAFSIQEILTNHTVRAQIPTFQSAYSGDIYTPDIDRMDLVEISAEADYQKQQTEQLKTQADELRTKRKAKNAKAQEDWLDQEFKKRASPIAPDATGA